VVFGYRDDEKVDTQVHDQENHQKCPHQSHDEFLGQRGKSKKFAHIDKILNNGLVIVNQQLVKRLFID
jgi:hypothetical protein